jgi:hypothetical protein
MEAMPGQGVGEGQWYTAETDPDDVQLNDEGRANLQRMLGGGHRNGEMAFALLFTREGTR